MSGTPAAAPAAPTKISEKPIKRTSRKSKKGTSKSPGTKAEETKKAAPPPPPDPKTLRPDLPVEPIPGFVTVREDEKNLTPWQRSSFRRMHAVPIDIPIDDQRKIPAAIQKKQKQLERIESDIKSQLDLLKASKKMAEAEIEQLQTEFVSGQRMEKRECVLYFHKDGKGQVAFLDPVTKKVIWKGDTYNVPEEKGLGYSSYMRDPLAGNIDIELADKIA
jgi:hypothetical protein